VRNGFSTPGMRNTLPQTRARWVDDDDDDDANGTSPTWIR
jgi:hypothetical protein